MSAVSRLLTRGTLAQMGISGGLVGAGNFLSQAMIRKEEKIDWLQVARYSCVGSFFFYPVLRTWYGTLDKVFKGTGNIVLLKKVASDQLIFAPFFIPVVITVLRTVDGARDFEKTFALIRQDYREVLLNNWKLWPLAQLINFSIVPPSYRVAFVQAVALLWNTYMSTIVSRPALEGGSVTKVTEEPVKG